MFQEVASFIINCLWTHKSLLDYRETSYLQDMIDEKFGVGSDLVGTNKKNWNHLYKRKCEIIQVLKAYKYCYRDGKYLLLNDPNIFKDLLPK